MDLLTYFCAEKSVSQIVTLTNCSLCCYCWIRS